MLSEQILSLFDSRLRRVFEQALREEDIVQEIRLRVGKPILLQQNDKELFLTAQGELRENAEAAVCATLQEIRGIVEAACGYSGYAFEEEIKRGYLTIAGGHRIGLVGRAVVENGSVQTLKNFSALNIRIAHPVTGCAEQWRSYLYEGKRPCHVLIISPPGCGKTTLLRDAVRCLSNGGDGYAGVTVGVVDERSEIAGTCRGLAAHELGSRTDVLDGCPKALGIEMLLRSMAPKVVAVDEIGVGDVPSIENALRCGCKLLATLHGEGLQDFLEKPGFHNLIKERVFDRYIFLKQGQTPGNVEYIYDRNFETIWEEGLCT